MPRPPRCRRICDAPQVDTFCPQGHEEAAPILLTLDEYEVIRLVDLEQRTHQQCAAQMDISRSTVQEIYESARRKIAACLVYGRKLVITGGSYRICGGQEQARCTQCCRTKSEETHSNMQQHKGEANMKIAVTYENGQARERTQVLMDLANKSGGMVIGTGDMSELALGWATYNGDHMSMYGVNASVPKTLVRHLVRYCADTCEDRRLGEVLYDILDTPVSPELLPPEDGKISQKTEDLVGPYELHDFFLYYVLRFGYAPGKIYRIAGKSFAGVYDDETILKWLKKFYWRFFAQQFKRSCLPDGPKVGSVAVSPRGDLRMPSDACVRLWQRELEKL